MYAMDFYIFISKGLRVFPWSLTSSLDWEMRGACLELQNFRTEKNLEVNLRNFGTTLPGQKLWSHALFTGGVYHLHSVLCDTVLPKCSVKMGTFMVKWV